MIDPTLIRTNPEIFKEAARKKRANFDVDEFLRVDEAYRSLLTKVEEGRASQNAFNKELPKFSGEEKAKKIAEMKDFAITLKSQETELEALKGSYQALLYRAPGIPTHEVPEGKDDSENVELKKVGELPKFGFEPKDHVTLGKALNILDIERGVKIAGTKNYFLKGNGARLQHAVLQAAIQFITDRGYTLFEPPHLVKYEAMLGTGYFPGGEDQAFALDDRDAGKFLIGTAEVPVTSAHMDEIVTDLPKRYAGYSPCYRREAGTYGKDTQGLYRIHQFYKVEQVVLCEASEETSRKFHLELLKNAEDFLQALEIPYRVVAVCTGDMGLGQVFKHDIESWMPSRSSYGETHSCSTFHEFQARRLGLRYRNEKGETRYCHTLNNTLVASPRILIPLLELNQNSDGSVNIPKILQPYMGGIQKITA